MLSIVVPVYNTAKYLNKCIDSILAQTYKDFELILVDDGSTDQSGKICDYYLEKDNRIKVIHKKNGGLISAWTEGTIKATGQYVGYVDSDDYILENYFETLMKPIEQYKCDISMCGFTQMNKNNDIIYPAEKELNGLFAEDKLESIKRNFYNNVNIQNSRCIKIFRRMLILQNLELLDKSITLGEDQTITVPCILDAKSIYINNSYFGYCYRIDDNSMSHLFNPKLIDNYVLLFNNITNTFTKKGFMNEYVYCAFEKHLITTAGLIAFSRNKIREKVTWLKLLKCHECSKKVLEFKLEDVTLSWKVFRMLLKLNAFYTICLIAKIKPH